MRRSGGGEDRKCAVFGAVEYASGQGIFQMSARKGEDAFLAFLEHLAQALPANEPAILALDNAGDHTSHLSHESPITRVTDHTCHQVQVQEQWWRFGDRLQPFFLPASLFPRVEPD